MWPPDPLFFPGLAQDAPRHQARPRSIRFHFQEPDEGMEIGDKITFAAVVQVKKIGEGAYELVVARVDGEPGLELP